VRDPLSSECQQLHRFVHTLSEVRWPFDLERLPHNGIYFFHETGESWGHGGDLVRIVRVGTHREGNFRSRIREHFLINERKMLFNMDQPAPKDRSIFRKNIGLALLHQANDPYEAVWSIDQMKPSARLASAGKRDVAKEREIERQVTRILRENFSFRCIELEGQERRMGTQGLESRFIGTAAVCDECRPSERWLGRCSPKPKIVDSGLWQEQHLTSPALSESEITELSVLCSKSPVAVQRRR